jgi:hypothetical protein
MRMHADPDPLENGYQNSHKGEKAIRMTNTVRNLTHKKLVQVLDFYENRHAKLS